MFFLRWSKLFIVSKYERIIEYFTTQIGYWQCCSESSSESESTRPEFESESIRPKCESIRCESESIGPESESKSIGLESESESNKCQSESGLESGLKSRLTLSLTHESNSRKVLYSNLTLDKFCWMASYIDNWLGTSISFFFVQIQKDWLQET